MTIINHSNIDQTIIGLIQGDVCVHSCDYYNNGFGIESTV